MSTTIESLQNGSKTAQPAIFKPQGFTLRRKIIVGFSGLMLLMALCIVITLYELTKIEKSTISVIEQQQPATISIMSFAEDLNLAISLLNEYLLSGKEEDIAYYQLSEHRLNKSFDEIAASAKQGGNNISSESIVTTKSMLDEFEKLGSRLIFLKDNPIDNYPGLNAAVVELNPIALDFSSLINEIINHDDIGASPNEEKKAYALLNKARYTWTQMMLSLRIYFNQDDITRHIAIQNIDDNLTNFTNYSNLNEQVLKELQELDIEIGFDAITTLLEIREKYLKKLPKILEFMHSGQWRADVTLMRNEVNPLVKEMRSLLAGLVDKQKEATNTSGNALTLSLEQIRTYTITLLAFALASGLLLSIMITRSILPPIRILMEAAGQVSTGDLNVKVKINSKDEISLLGSSFNIMVDELHKAKSEKQQHTTTLETLNSELELSEARIRTIYDNVGEGIIVIDEKGYIDSINPAAQRIFNVGNKDISGMHAIFLLADKKYTDLTNSEFYTDEKDSPFNASNSKHAIDLEGKRFDGSTFPIEMVVTNMTLGENCMRICIVRDITQRKNAEMQLVEAQNNVADAAHKSGMAEIATGVLHNIGNILNSVNVSVEEISRIARNSKIKGMIKANAMLSDNLKNVSEFISTDSKGQKLPEYYITIGDVINNELNKIVKESTSLSEKTTMMKDVISTQQAYATAGFFTEEFQVAPLVEDALRVQAASLHKCGINVTKRFAEIPDVSAQKSKLLQVITNLIKNAKEATVENDELNKQREIVIEIDVYNKNAIYINVSDNGCGINAENLSNIFNHGFTTKETGHGFGLHSSANAMTEMGGSLTVSSAGSEQGACFTASIPTTDAKQKIARGNNHKKVLEVISES